MLGDGASASRYAWCEAIESEVRGARDGRPRSQINTAASAVTSTGADNQSAQAMIAKVLVFAVREHQARRVCGGTLPRAIRLA